MKKIFSIAFIFAALLLCSSATGQNKTTQKRAKKVERVSDSTAVKKDSSNVKKEAKETPQKKSDKKVEKRAKSKR